MSHGRLVHHDFTSSKDLANIPLGDLGAEMLDRMATNVGHGSQSELEKHLELFNRLRDAFEDATDVWQNRASVAQTAVQFRFVNYCRQRHGIPMAKSVHVDVGCGSVNPLARLFTHAMLGASRVIAIDLDLPATLDSSTRRLAQLAAAALIDPTRLFGDYPITREAILANLAGFDLGKLRRGDASGIPLGRVTMSKTPIEATELETESVDVVFSNSVLEHVQGVDAALAELARITKPGGYGVHGIDAIDHRWYGEPGLHPLEFLTVDASERMVCGCNRVRLVEFPELFRRHGFEIVDRWSSDPIAIPPELRARMVEPWRSMPDDQLDRTWANVLVRRP